VNTLFIGKPSQATLEYAENRLCEILESFNSNIKLLNPEFHPDKPLEIIYMIGGNPKTDIQGGNSFRSQRGIEWKSVLVETANYETRTIPEYPPRAILPGIAEAVDWAMNDAKKGGSPKQSSDTAS
jgi:ribonucleotide monophosphatase NagD (HAD superfamily)